MPQTIATAIFGLRINSRRLRARGPSGRGGSGRGLSRKAKTQTPAAFSAAAAR